MQTLYFVKFQNKHECDQIVFLFTADSPESAESLGLAHIAETYRGNYKLSEVTAVCQTPDVVTAFEPC